MFSHILGIAGNRVGATGVAELDLVDDVDLVRGGWATTRIPRFILPSLSLRWALLAISALTLWRIVALLFDRTDFFVDEAQYWLWSRNLAFGYYSKPPMIAWILRAVAELSGSDDIFWVRICGPLFHFATSLVLMKIAARLFGRETAIWTGLTYITLPGVALSSVFFSTDVILLFFLALALEAYLALTEKRSAAMAVVLGLSVAAAFLSKYAILFVLPGGLLAVACLPRARVAWRDFCLSVAIAILGSIPNLWWNFNNRMVTVTHTESIAHWHDLNFRWLRGLDFFAAQFGVVGPIVFAAILMALYRAVRMRNDWREQLLLLLSVPVIALITFQAAIAKAYANWAVTAYVAGTILAVWTLRSVWPEGLRWSLRLNGAVACLVALMPAFAPQLSNAGVVAVDRYLGRSEVSNDAARLAGDLSLSTIVSDNRDMLADMFYTLRGQPLLLYSRTGAGAPQSYYDEMYPMPKDLSRPVIFVSTEPAACGAGESALVKTWQPKNGTYRGKTIYAYRMDSSCLEAR